MKITDIEIHEIHPPLQEFNRDALQLHMGGSYDSRTLVVLHTDKGLEGLGDVGGPPDARLKEELEQLRGTNPATWLAHRTLSIGLAPAIYDLVGKALQVPAYHLFGPQVRSWVPLGYWTVSRTPARMADEVVHAARLGYTWLKYHTDPFHNVIDQTRAMQEVAPPGFKIHYDMNFHSSVEHIVGVARELSQFPIAGLIEDPLKSFDMEGHKLLREKSPLPIVFHHLPLGGREALTSCADGYMLGHAPVGMVVERAGLFEATNIPFMMQNVGLNITRALVIHMAAAFEMATLHHVTDTFAWQEDVVTPVFEVVGGTAPVPQEPGLGLHLDRAALERLKAATPHPMPKALIRVERQGGPVIYSRPPRSRGNPLCLEPRFVPGVGEGYTHPIDYDYWLDDGSDAFAAMWERTESENIIEY